MKKMYQEPNLTFVEFIMDVVTASEATSLGNGDWGVEDDFV